MYTKKEDQRKRFLKVLKKRVKTQAQFKEEYEKMFSPKTIAQSTIAGYFRDFNIKQGNDGIYYLDDSDKISEIVSSSCTNVGKIHTDFFQIVVKCDIGKEKELCEALMKKFPTKLQSIIPAYASIMIVCAFEKNAKSIRKYIQRYCIKRNNNESES